MTKYHLFITTLVFTACAAPVAPSTDTEPKEGMEQSSQAAMEPHMAMEGLDITPISHATMVMHWDSTVLYTDPTGGSAAFSGQPEADIILVTDIHGDHLDPDTLAAITADETVLIVPQAVYDELSVELQSKATILGNNETITVEGFTVEGVPMYNLPESEDSRHAKGRGNGYIVEKDGTRVYISGDTADIPEMRNLQDIDIAFVCMNLPYTMDAATAADAVLDFAPAKVYPYHYRQPEGFADTAEFKQIVNTGNPDIEVVQLEWYPES